MLMVLFFFHQLENKLEIEHCNYVLSFLNVCKLSTVHVIL